MTEPTPEPEVRHTQTVQSGGTATAEHGIVMLDGPDGVAVAMTPDAASETAHSLYSAADEARLQTPQPSASD